MREVVGKNPLGLLMGIVAFTVLMMGTFTVAPSFGQAETSTSTIKIPFNTDPFDPCFGEIVEVSGDAEFVAHTTISPDGESTLSVKHLSTSGVTGTTESGDEVVISQVEKSISNERTDKDDIFRNSIKLRIASSEQEPSILVHITFHTILNPDGSVKVENSHVSVKCVGKDHN